MNRLDEYARAAAMAMPWGGLRVHVEDQELDAEAIALDVLSWAHRVGLLSIPDLPRIPTSTEVEEAARWLAEIGGHPRWSEAGHGWRGILTSRASLDHAAAAAREAVVDRQTRGRVDEVHALLRTFGVPTNDQGQGPAGGVLCQIAPQIALRSDTPQLHT